MQLPHKLSLLFQSNEVRNSYNMEKEGLDVGLKNLQKEGIPINELVTDRHPQVTKYMRDKHPTIKHSFDVWHVAKGILIIRTRIGCVI